MRPFYLVVVMTAFGGGGCAWQQLFNRAAAPSQEEQIESLARAINDAPDPLHSDHTPAVHQLIEIGDPVIPRMLALMLLDGREDQFTRLHAQTVLYYIVLKRNGFESGRGWSDPKGSERANALWKSLGDLDYKAPREERVQAVKLWRDWLAKNKT